MSHSENGSIMNDKDTNNRTSLQQNNSYRLCHIVKRSDFDGYGFNLHSEKGKPGQYIGKVDDKSPAEQSGLRQGDRIIEVNDYNIGNDTHKQVVQRIKAITNEVRLLVIDPIEYDKQQKQQKLSPTPTTTITTTTSTKKESSDLEDNNNKTITPTPTTAGSVSPTTSTKSQTNSINSASIKTDISTSTIIVGATNGHSLSNDATDSTNKLNNETTITTTSTTKPLNKTTTDIMMSGGGGSGGGVSVSSTLQSNGNSTNQQQQQQHQLQQKSTTTTTTTSSSSSGAGLNLPMTAAEMRAKLMAKKKYDPKNDSVDLRKKFEIIQKL